jgi:hypothetical protein
MVTLAPAVLPLMRMSVPRLVMTEFVRVTGSSVAMVTAGVWGSSLFQLPE